MNTMRTAVMIVAAVASCAALALPSEYARIKASDFDRGYVRSMVSAAETHDFSAPPGASVAERMARRGGATDYVRVSLSRWAFPFGGSHYRDFVLMGDGTVRFGDGVALSPALGQLGMVPREGWGSLPESYGPDKESVVWYEERKDSFVATWRNALLRRGVSAPVCYQVELYRSGDVTMRFDLSRVPAGNPAFMGLWQEFGLTRPTTVVYRRLSAADMANADVDGDGVDTERELLDRHTDPRCNDTDGDSLYDLPESMYGTSALAADTDGDGYGDATDPDPRHATPWDDSDGDGMPDAWVAKWFGGTAPDPYGDAGGDGVGNLASLYIGVRPDTSAALGTQAPRGLVPANVRAFKFAPSAFSFGRPEALTNLVDRTFAVDRVSPWQQLFVTSDLTTYSGWTASDVEIAWEAGGEAGQVPLDGWDSFRIPVSHTNAFQLIRLTLKAAGPAPSLDRPLFLAVWVPEMAPSEATYNVVLSGTSKFPVYLVANDDGGTYGLPCSVSRAGYPHVGGVDADVEAALAMPVVPGVSFDGSRLVAGGVGRYTLPRQGLKTGVLVVVHHVNWW